MNGALSHDYDLRDVDGNGHVPDAERHRRRCGCCQKVADNPMDIAMFSLLLAPGGKAWDICGKCIQVLWRKRAPKPEPIEMLCA